MSSDGRAGELDAPAHREWLLDQSVRLIEFFRAAIDEHGRFVALDDDGRELTANPGHGTEQLLTVARLTHSYALGELLGLPDCGPIVEQGLNAMTTRYRDSTSGGYLSSFPAGGSPVKSAYDHAHVLLAASSAIIAGHDAGRPLFDDVLGVIDDRFWSEADGAARESFDRGWHELEPYRGANSNMHLCEALLAAASAMDRADLAERAVGIARRLIDGEARSRRWLLPEHYDSLWQAEPEFHRDRPDDPFRPYGVTPGHLLEWSRLCCSAWLATGRRDAWLVEAAEQLFARAVEIGWDEQHGGIIYTVGWDATPVNDDHYWWPVAEAIAASAFLARLVGGADYGGWYERFWDFASTYLIDHERGGWYPQLDAENERKSGPWFGKPDLYHALQACIIPGVAPAPSVAASLRPGTAG
jgi:mannose/cellobiose epimerase-like protein (N-acyl-D-glucosamine 2-epimerase family)